MSVFKKLSIISIFIAVSILYVMRADNTNKTSQTSRTFVLVTVLYNETDFRRIKEYLICLKKNVAHPLISQIHVIYDQSKDSLSEEQVIHDYLQKNDIAITYSCGRPTYGECFALVNKLYPHRSIILSNADIYFNGSLAQLNNYDLSNKFLALTRWNVCADGRIVPYNVPYRTISQDAWIFESPIRKFEDDHIFIGTNECDSFVAYQAQKAGMMVLNPCLSIQCCHLHLSDVRNHNVNKHNRLPADYRPARWSKL